MRKHTRGRIQDRRESWPPWRCLLHFTVSRPKFDSNSSEVVIGWAMAMTWLFMGVTTKWDSPSPRGTDHPEAEQLLARMPTTPTRGDVRHTANITNHSLISIIIGTCSSDVLKAFGNASSLF